jgi:hypothetical protein
MKGRIFGSSGTASSPSAVLNSNARVVDGTEEQGAKARRQERTLKRPNRLLASLPGPKRTRLIAQRTGKHADDL